MLPPLDEPARITEGGCDKTAGIRRGVREHRLCQPAIAPRTDRHGIDSRFRDIDGGD